MKVWKDREGNALDSMEFLNKWKKGIQNITPLQMARITYRNTWLMILGLLLGIVFTLSSFKTLWWLTIILVAALGNTIMVQVGNYQKYVAYKEIEQQQKLIVGNNLQVKGEPK